VQLHAWLGLPQVTQHSQLAAQQALLQRQAHMLASSINRQDPARDKQS
jgi:hypothetical protein